jgi:hypothetical protein
MVPPFFVMMYGSNGMRKHIFAKPHGQLMNGANNVA